MKTGTLGITVGLILHGILRLQGADQVFFGNLHSHTSYSDGSGTPSQAFAHARDTAKLDFLAITEHNHRDAEGTGDRKDAKHIGKDASLYNGTASSALIPAAKRFTEAGRFVALYGQEFSSISQGNHVNVFDIPDVIDEGVVANGQFAALLSWLQTRPDTTGQKAILQFNHAKLFDNNAKEYGADDFGSQAEWIRRMSEHAALFEMLNGPAMTKTSNNRAAETMESDYDYYLLLGFRLAPTGDQDNHYKTWGTATDARTGVIADELSKAKLLEALRKRHVYASEDKNLRLVFKVNGQLCGDVLPAPAVGSELAVSYTIQDSDESDASYIIHVRVGTIGGSAVNEIESVAVSGNTPSPQSIQDIRYTGAGQFIYFQVTQANEDDAPDRAWTAPVWFSAETHPIAGDAAEDASGFVASKNSAIYHISAGCSSAKSIKAANLITGAAAKAGRTKHQNCPLT